VARRLRIGRNAAYDAANKGEIPAIRVGRTLRVPVRAFERLLDAFETPAHPESRTSSQAAGSTAKTSPVGMPPRRKGGRPRIKPLRAPDLPALRRATRPLGTTSQTDGGISDVASNAKSAPEDAQ
jgi:excisionase family DNA binding protein